MKKMKIIKKPQILLRRGAFTIALENAYKAFICFTYCNLVQNTGFRSSSTANGGFMHLGISRSMNPAYSTTAYGLQIHKGTEIRTKLPQSLLEFLSLPNGLTYKSLTNIATIRTKMEHLLTPNSKLSKQLFEMLRSEVEKIGQQLNVN